MSELLESKTIDTIASSDTEKGKCASCGGILVFSPERGMLHCDYCGADVVLDFTPANVVENDFEEYSQHPGMMNLVETFVAKVTCAQCGAQTTFPENATSFSCTFCGTPIVLNTSVQSRVWQPEYLLPFKIAEKECMQHFKKWASSRWFAPAGFAKKLIAEGRLQGVYLPYWTYDADTLTCYTGRKGTEHTDSKNKTYISWKNVSGRIEKFFDDVLVAASDYIPKNVEMYQTKWDKENYVTYNEHFMKGFLTLLYQRDFKECYGDAQIKMRSEITVAINKQIGGDRQEIKSQNTTYSNVKFKLILLPMWMSAFKYNSKSYLFTVNGRNAQVSGNRPWSAPKLIAFIFLIIVIIVLLFRLYIK